MIFYRSKVDHAVLDLTSPDGSNSRKLGMVGVLSNTPEQHPWAIFLSNSPEEVSQAALLNNSPEQSP